MARVNAKTTTLAFVGMLCGMALLAFAGTLVIIPRSSVIAGVTGGMRRLETFAITAPTFQGATPAFAAPTAPTAAYAAASDAAAAGDAADIAAAVAARIGAITTTLPSSFDSSDSSASGSSLEPSKSLEPGSMMRGGFEQIEGLWLTAGTNTMIQLLFMLIFAIVYNRNVVEPVLATKGTLDMKMQSRPETGADDFDNTICECFSDKWVCIHGLCCPLVRMAQTNAVAGIMSFWGTAFCWCCCAFWTGGMGPCCLMIWFRMRLKQVMKIEDHLCNDFCVTLFCPLLAVCQQGTAVDTAMGYEVTGCCDLEWSDDMAMLTTEAY